MVDANVRILPGKHRGSSSNREREPASNFSPRTGGPTAGNCRVKLGPQSPLFCQSIAMGYTFLHLLPLFPRLAMRVGLNVLNPFPASVTITQHNALASSSTTTTSSSSFIHLILTTRRGPLRPGALQRRSLNRSGTLTMPSSSDKKHHRWSR